MNHTLAFSRIVSVFLFVVSLGGPASLGGPGGGTARGTEVLVRNAESLRTAIRDLQPGTTLRIAPGEYPGGHYTSGIADLTVAALDPDHPPRFRGGSNGWQFSRCPNLTLRHLKFSGQTHNGLNLDDGGRFEQPVTGITLIDLEISDIGPRGNFDGIKCSGLAEMEIRDCTVAGWGGQGIDMVGCHRSLISGCRFIGKPGFTASAAVQTKGGSSEITIEKCHFLDAGERPLNVGGSTGLTLFRPPGVKYEARAIVVRDNVIEGSSCAAAFVGVDGATFSDNTVLFPQRWIFRILQETTAPGFVPTRNVRVENNRIVFRRSDLASEINIGPGTDPASFRFRGNRWFAADRPGASEPNLPVAETAGSYGIDPRRE